MDRYFNHKVLLDSARRKRYREVQVLPTIPKTPDDTYIISTIGDRLDILAFSYYKTVTLWWVIAAANPDIQFSSLYLEPNIQIRIPSEATVNDIGNLMMSLNNNR